MRIAFVLDSAYESSGVVNLTLTHVRHLRSQGLEVLLIARRPGRIAEVPVINADVRILPDLRGPRLPTMIQTILQRRLVQRLLTQFGPSVVVAARQGGLVAAYSRRWATWLYVHQSEQATAEYSTNPVLSRAFSRRVFLRIDRIVARLASRVLIPSTAIEEEVEAATSHRPIVAPPLFENPHSPAKADPRRQGDVKFIWVGRLHPIKAPHRAIAWIERLRESGVPARLEFIGSGPLEYDLRRQITASNLQQIVTFRGQLGASAVLNAIEQADVLLITSESESFGLVVYEALSRGLPVVGRPIGVLPRAAAVCDGVVVTEGPTRAEVERVIALDRNDTIASFGALLAQDRIAVAKAFRLDPTPDLDS